MSQERRIHPRHTIDLHAELVVEQTHLQGRTLDINNHGTLLTIANGETSNTLTGKHAKVWLQSDGGEIIEFPCIIRHTYSKKRLGLQFMGQDITEGIKLRLLLNSNVA